jgi:23S rRNA G2445 N2-methylase RlmL
MASDGYPLSTLIADSLALLIEAVEDEPEIAPALQKAYHFGVELLEKMSDKEIEATDGT